MKQFGKRFLKFLLKVLIASVVVGLIFYLISLATGLPLAEAFQYGGIACILLGFLSLTGKMNMTANPTYLQSKSVSDKSITESTLEEFRSRDGNYRFLILMAVTGAVLIGLSYLIDFILK
jgi:hypothetical protein